MQNSLEFSYQVDAFRYSVSYYSSRQSYQVDLGYSVQSMHAKLEPVGSCAPVSCQPLYCDGS